MAERAMADEGSLTDQKRIGLLEILDDLIYHVNSERTWFSILMISSLVVAPLSLFFTFFLLLHPKIMLLMFRLSHLSGLLVLVYLIANVFVSALWLAVGVREFKFFRGWSDRFRQFSSLKERFDREFRELEKRS